MLCRKWDLICPISIVWTKMENAIKTKAKSGGDHLLQAMFICLCVCVFSCTIWSLLCSNIVYLENYAIMANPYYKGNRLALVGRFE